MNDFYSHDGIVMGCFQLEHHDQQQQIQQQQQQHQQQLSSLPSSSLSNVVVQIHTTDITQPTISGKGGGGNSFRRNNHNQLHSNHSQQYEEIKSEHIKSENETTGVNKDRITAIPTPPSRVAVLIPDVHRVNNGRDEQTVNTKDNSKSPSPSLPLPPLSTSISAPSPLSSAEVFKCKQCPFLSLSLAKLELHATASHADEQTQMVYNTSTKAITNCIRMKCPGCENIFYVTNSLLVHLQEDHLLGLSDANKLLDTVVGGSSSGVDVRGATATCNQIGSNSENITATMPSNIHETQRNGRIFLKHVDCLRAPATTSSESIDSSIHVNVSEVINDHHQHHHGAGTQLFDSNHQLTNETNNFVMEEGDVALAFGSPMPPVAREKPPKQKISIKSVDVLREPTLLRRDYEMQNFPTIFATNNITNDLTATTTSPSPIYTNAEQKQLQFFTYNSEGDVDDDAVANVKINAVSMVCDNNDDTNNNNNATYSIQQSNDSFENERRPKIYIKNVDILKKTMANANYVQQQHHEQGDQPADDVQQTNRTLKYNFATDEHLTVDGAFIHSGENFSSLISPYDLCNLPTFCGSAAGGEQYLFENTSTNLIQNVGEIEDLSLTNGIGSIGGIGSCQLLDDLRFPSALMDFGVVSSVVTEPTPSPPAQPPPQPPPIPSASLIAPLPPVSLLSGPTPSYSTASLTSTSLALSSTSSSTAIVPLNNVCNGDEERMSAPKQKIFIKNVDVLKAPQFQETRRTLHLRTVDELNLMNKNEVQNLIAPNLETATNDVAVTTTLTAAAYSKIQPPNVLGAATNASNLKFDDFVMHEEEGTGWSTDYDLGDEFDCIITETIGSTVSYLNNNNNCNTNNNNTLNCTVECTNSLSQGLALQIDRNASNNQSSSIVVDHPQNITYSVEQHSEEAGIANIATSEEGFINAESNNNNSVVNSSSFKANDVEVNCDVTHAMVNKIFNNEMMPQPLPPPSSLPPPQLVAPEKNISCEATASAAPPLQPPPLAPVTSNMDYDADIPMETMHKNLVSSMPPLVPVPPLIQIRNQQSTEPSTKTSKRTPCINGPNLSATTKITSNAILSTNDKARIYVANNLLQHSNNNNNDISCRSGSSGAKSLEDQTNAVVFPTAGAKSLRGRPFGSKSSNVTKTKKESKSANNSMKRESELKCTVQGCAFRFKKTISLDYHLRCHGTFSDSLTGIICPNCHATFTNWNTLHTHLWRTHQIDMELYCCKLCNFKTPIYSRLVNTHAKIHFEERNYKCGECAKAFKNTKQLKNHRRWHRIHARSEEENDDVDAIQQQQQDKNIHLHRCNDCGAAFSHRKSLQEHCCTLNTTKTPLKCEVCGHVLSSKSALKLHARTHEAMKRFQCTICSYTTSDHNACRRHKMTHRKGDGELKARVGLESAAGAAGTGSSKVYSCPYCDYKSIQSLSYKNHVQRKHPELADSTIYKCDICFFSTVNCRLFLIHQSKHQLSTVISDPGTLPPAP